MHAGSQPGNTETYVMSGVGSIPNLAIVPPPVGIELVGNEPPPEYILDQGLSYSAADNYGYLQTGYEPSAEWGEHHSIYGLDGQDLHYMGLQAESMPYMYYTPGYGYTQAPLNQYASYVPGALSGLEGTYLGVQPYVNIPSYQPTTSSPAYFPIIVQPSSDFVPASSNYPYLLGNGASIATRSATANAKIAPPLGSAGSASSSQLVTSVAPFAMSDASQPSQRNLAAAKPSEGLQINIPASNQSLLQETRMHGIGPLGYQGVNSGQMQSSFQVSHGRTPFAQNHVKIAAQSSGLADYAPSGIGWSNREKKSQGNQLKEIPSYMGRNADALGEQNSGPRKSRPKDQLVSSSVVETAELTQSNTSDAQEGYIVIRPDNYNKDDFPVDYPDAKFFVIKSYSEDDVHKSIKYNTWSSTHNGNRRLDSAYADAQRKAIGSSKKCPVFLFFSVNASGQFCGLAEMDGPVDFDKDMNFWQQDKWSGSFHVKWHIIKDVPNANLRHIILENNENKPVTNSRDTQEIPYSAGINMLKIFKSSLLRTSILDDFMFYEERQKKMLEDKFKRHGRIYDDSLYVPAYVSQNRPDSRVETSKVGDSQSSGTGQSAHEFGHQTDTVSEQPLKNKEKLQDDTILSPSKIDGGQSGVVTDSLRTERKQTNAAVGLFPSADWKHSTTPKDLVPRENVMQHSTVVLPSKVELYSKPSASHPPSDEKLSSKVINELLTEETGPPTPEEPPKVDGKQSKWRVSRPLSSDGSTNIPNDANGVGKAGSSYSESQFKNKIHASETSSNKDIQQSELDGKQTKWRISRPPSSDESTNRLQDANSVGKASPGDEQFKNKIHASESSSNKDTQLEFDGKQTKWRINRPPSSDGSTIRLKDANGVSKAGSGEEPVKNKIHSSESSSIRDTRSELDGKPSKWRIRSPSSDGSTNRAKGVNGVGQVAASESSSNKEAQSEDKAGIPSVHPTIGEPRSLGAMEVKVNPIEFVTVGSVQIKVKDHSEPNSVSGVGSQPSESKGPKLSKKGTSADSQEQKK